jgi:hypothetical protein
MRSGMMNKKLLLSEKNQLLKGVNESKKIHDTIYLLIRSYENDVTCGGMNGNIIPYNGELDEGGQQLTFLLSKFPIELQRVLFEYYSRVKKEEEDGEGEERGE